jgi:hypothetical protein
MSTHRHLRRTDLFLVRVWSKGTGDIRGADGSKGKIEWYGKVQRVVSGESHEFSSLQDLVDALLAMLSDNEGR